MFKKVIFYIIYNNINQICFSYALLLLFFLIKVLNKNIFNYERVIIIIIDLNS